MDFTSIGFVSAAFPASVPRFWAMSPSQGGGTILRSWRLDSKRASIYSAPMLHHSLSAASRDHGAVAGR